MQVSVIIVINGKTHWIYVYKQENTYLHITLYSIIRFRSECQRFMCFTNYNFTRPKGNPSLNLMLCSQ